MAGVGIVETQAGKDELILVLNSGSSSLKFGIYSRGASDEEPLLSGSADGIGRSNGELHIRLFQRKIACAAREYPRVAKRCSRCSRCSNP